MTDRSRPAHKRAILTLRAWNIRIDEAHFLGGAPKAPVLKAFAPHMFFDDKPEYCSAAAEHVPTGQVLQPFIQEVSNVEQEEVTISIVSEKDSSGKERFLLACKRYLKADFAPSVGELECWYEAQLSEFPKTEEFLQDLEFRIMNTPQLLEERRARGKKNARKTKLMALLVNLKTRHLRSGTSH